MNWIHNMSSAPRAAIVQAPRPEFETTRGVLLRFDDSVADTSVTGILSRLGIEFPPNAGLAGTLLSKVIDEWVRKLPFPPAAIVSDRATGHEREETDLLTVCTVMSKSSQQLYLRDKEPNLNAIRRSRRLTLLIPKNWTPT